MQSRELWHEGAHHDCIDVESGFLVLNRLFGHSAAFVHEGTGCVGLMGVFCLYDGNDNCL